MRPPKPTTTVLGAALREKRGSVAQAEISEALGLKQQTLSRVERGLHRPTFDTARTLARWLGWTVEQVMDAADQPAPDAPS